MNTTVQRIKMLRCPACGEFTLHPKRKELGYHVCVNCSTTKPVVGITTVEGTGDHTYNDMIIMDQDRAAAIASKAAELAGKKVDIEMLDLDADEAEMNQTVKEQVQKILDDEKEEEEEEETKETKIKGIDY